MKVTVYLSNREEFEAFSKFTLDVAKLQPTREESEAKTETLFSRVAMPLPEQAAPAPAVAIVHEPVAAEPPKKGRPKKVETAAPVEQAPAPAPEAAAQDVKDETPVASPDATIDDVRRVMGDYVKKYGMPAAQADGPKLLAEMFGEGCKKISDIPNTPAAFGKAVAAIVEMSEKNLNKREPV